MDKDLILLGHGSGGRMMRELIETFFVPAFADGNTGLGSEDSAVLDLKIRQGERLAVTTDSYVVSPVFFPGGNIGDLAVNGTVNDLAMSGARPLFLSAGFIIEEGLAMETLWKVVWSMQQAAERAGVAPETVSRWLNDANFVAELNSSLPQQTQRYIPGS